MKNSREANTKILEAFEEILSSESDIESFINQTRFLGFFMANNPGKRIYSDIIERKIRYFQKKIFSPPLPLVPKKVLHVATQIYLTGGHTRVIENWINYFPEEEHDIVLISQVRKFSLSLPPKTEILNLRSDISDLQRIQYLNELYAQYESVIFHIHPHDVIPLIAMGDHPKTRFKFYNHSDHTFSFGPSLCDIVYDMSSKGSQFTLSFRGARRSQVIPFPLKPVQIDKQPTTHSKQEARRLLQIPNEAKVVLSVGTEYKFNPNEEFNLFDKFSKIANKYENFIFIFIGPDETYKKFAPTEVNNIRFLGRVDKSTVINHYLAGDLYIDSLPIGGGLAMIEAALYGLPIVTFDNGFNAFDAAEKFRIEYQDLEDRITSLLLDDSARGDLQARCLKEARKHVGEEWKNNFSLNPIRDQSDANLPPKYLEKYTELISQKYRPFTIPRINYRLPMSTYLYLVNLAPGSFILKSLVFQTFYKYFHEISGFFLDKKIK